MPLYSKNITQCVYENTSIQPMFTSISKNVICEGDHDHETHPKICLYQFKNYVTNVAFRFKISIVISTSGTQYKVGMLLYGANFSMD